MCKAEMARKLQEEPGRVAIPEILRPASFTTEAVDLHSRHVADSFWNLLPSGGNHAKRDKMLEAAADVVWDLWDPPDVLQWDHFVQQLAYAGVLLCSGMVRLLLAMAHFSYKLSMVHLHVLRWTLVGLIFGVSQIIKPRGYAWRRSSAAGESALIALLVWKNRMVVRAAGIVVCDGGVRRRYGGV